MEYLASKELDYYLKSKNYLKTDLSNEHKESYQVN